MVDHGLQSANCPLQQVDVWTEAGREALSHALGFAAPEEPGHVVQHGGVRVARISPRRFWIIGETPLVSLDPEHGTSLRLDQGRISIHLPGDEARGVLPQFMVIDWDSPRATPGRIVLSAIHRIPVAVLPRNDGTFELIVPRSFAESIAGLIGEGQAA